MIYLLDTHSIYFSDDVIITMAETISCHRTSLCGIIGVRSVWSRNELAQLWHGSINSSARIYYVYIDQQWIFDVCIMYEENCHCAENNNLDTKREVMHGNCDHGPGVVLDDVLNAVARCPEELSFVEIPSTAVHGERLHRSINNQHIASRYGPSTKYIQMLATSMLVYLFRD